ncbi:hypothetical protein BZA77DRAFT_357264 [Pyronema omphalodes]|nr:hypothetical protein BZA77DRAFT_357264 [Pyronema omphalodes]
MERSVTRPARRRRTAGTGHPLVSGVHPETTGNEESGEDEEPVVLHDIGPSIPPPPQPLQHTGETPPLPRQIIRPPPSVSDLVAWSRFNEQIALRYRAESEEMRRNGVERPENVDIRARVERIARQLVLETEEHKNLHQHSEAQQRLQANRETQNSEDFPEASHIPELQETGTRQEPETAQSSIAATEPLENQPLQDQQQISILQRAQMPPRPMTLEQLRAMNDEVLSGIESVRQLMRDMPAVQSDQPQQVKTQQTSLIDQEPHEAKEFTAANSKETKTKEENQDPRQSSKSQEPQENPGPSQSQWKAKRSSKISQIPQESKRSREFLFDEMDWMPTPDEDVQLHKVFPAGESGGLSNSTGQLANSASNSCHAMNKEFRRACDEKWATTGNQEATQSISSAPQPQGAAQEPETPVKLQKTGRISASDKEQHSKEEFEASTARGLSEIVGLLANSLSSNVPEAVTEFIKDFDELLAASGLVLTLNRETSDGLQEITAQLSGPLTPPKTPQELKQQQASQKPLERQSLQEPQKRQEAQPQEPQKPLEPEEPQKTPEALEPHVPVELSQKTPEPQESQHTRELQNPQGSQASQNMQEQQKLQLQEKQKYQELKDSQELQKLQEPLISQGPQLSPDHKEQQQTRESNRMRGESEQQVSEEIEEIINFENQERQGLIELRDQLQQHIYKFDRLLELEKRQKRELLEIEELGKGIDQELQEKEKNEREKQSQPCDPQKPEEHQESQESQAPEEPQAPTPQAFQVSEEPQAPTPQAFQVSEEPQAPASQAPVSQESQASEEPQAPTPQAFQVSEKPQTSASQAPVSQESQASEEPQAPTPQAFQVSEKPQTSESRESQVSEEPQAPATQKSQVSEKHQAPASQESQAVEEPQAPASQEFQMSQKLQKYQRLKEQREPQEITKIAAEILDDKNQWIKQQDKIQLPILEELQAPQEFQLKPHLEKHRTAVNLSLETMKERIENPPKQRLWSDIIHRENCFAKKRAADSCKRRNMKKKICSAEAWKVQCLRTRGPTPVLQTCEHCKRMASNQEALKYQTFLKNSIKPAWFIIYNKAIGAQAEYLPTRFEFDFSYKIELRKLWILWNDLRKNAGPEIGPFVDRQNWWNVRNMMHSPPEEPEPGQSVSEDESPDSGQAALEEPDSQKQQLEQPDSQEKQLEQPASQKQQLEQPVIKKPTCSHASSLVLRAAEYVYSKQTDMFYGLESHGVMTHPQEWLFLFDCLSTQDAWNYYLNTLKFGPDEVCSFILNWIPSRSFEDWLNTEVSTDKRDFVKSKVELLLGGLSSRSDTIINALPRIKNRLEPELLKKHVAELQSVL